MNNLKAYDNYKPSGVEWLGDVPEHWEVKRVKSISRVRRGASPRPIADPRYFSDNGKYSWVRIADVTANNHYLLETKDTLSKLGASLSVKIYDGELFLSIAGSVGKPMISKIKCCIHDGFVYFPDLKNSQEFLYRVFETGRPYVGLGKHGTQLNLNTETIGNIKIPFPPLAEQTKIANYLDRKTAQINQAIAQKEELIELLKERRQVLIHQAVTQGLDSSVEMKDSGVEWIGDVPKHWEVKRIKHIAEMLVSNVDKHIKKLERPVQLCNYVDVYKNDFITNEIDFMKVTATKSEIERFKIKIGDVIITKDSEDWLDIGVPALVKYEEENLICGYHLAILRPFPNVNGSFLFRVISNIYVRTQFSVKANGVTRYGISHGAILRTFVAIPPKEEQIEIANYIDIQTEKIQTAIRLKKQEIGKLKEYKTVLIDAAVTGKVIVN
jgi:type I restriction enzyme S subunit